MNPELPASNTYFEVTYRGVNMSLKTTQYTLPAHWASYLINGDASGLEDGEQATIDAFLAKEGNPHFCDCDDVWFARYNDAGTPACYVCEYTAIVP